MGFNRYEDRSKAFIAAKQEAAVKFASFSAPRSRLSMFVGNQVTRLVAIPFVTELAVGRELRAALELPAY